MQISTTRHSSNGSTGSAAACGASSTGSGLNSDTSCTGFSGGGVGRESTAGASAADTPARAKAVSAGSGSLRWDDVAAATEAIERASSAPTGPVSALEIVAPRAAPRFQIAVAVFRSEEHTSELQSHHDL